MTPLHSTLKRALTIDGRDYVLTLNETALKITLKGKRKGVELPWTQLVNGEAALAVALHASLGAFAEKDTTRTSEPPAAAKAYPAGKPFAVGKPSPPDKSARLAKPKRKTAPTRKK
jgi:hypothetical protein